MYDWRITQCQSLTLSSFLQHVVEFVAISDAQEYFVSVKVDEFDGERKINLLYTVQCAGIDCLCKELVLRYPLM